MQLRALQFIGGLVLAICGTLAWGHNVKVTPLGSHAGVTFVRIETLLAESDVVSIHLALNDETKNFLSRERIAAMRGGAILINTARGALVDEDALIDALRAGRLRHAGLDVFAVEPLPPGHPLTLLPNVTLSAHSAFRTPEASENLLRAAVAHCSAIARRAADSSASA